MSKSKNSDQFAAVATVVSTLWTSYKRNARRRNEKPMEMFINDIFGAELNDIDAAKLFAQDVAEIRGNLRTKRTKNKFDSIITNSY